MLSRLTDGLEMVTVDEYLIRDAQRIESIESLVRIHNAQEDDIYDHAAAGDLIHAKGHLACV
jgi:hypothetical protein